MNTRGRAWLMALWLVATPAAWAAGGGATIEAGDGADRVRIGVQYLDDKLRMETQDLAQGQIQAVTILRDGRLYLVAGGMVLDAAQAMSAFGQSMQAPSTLPEQMRRFIALEPTGRSETVAGIAGKVFALRYQDDAGATRTDELVLSEDARARALSQALLRLAQAMKAHAPAVPTAEDEARLLAALNNRGVLRYADHFRVAGFAAAAPTAASFELPSRPLVLPSFGR